MKTIVLGYDSTDASARALERTAEIAAAFGSSVIVTSVSGTMGGAVHAGGAGDPTDPPDAHEALLDQATTQLVGRGVQAESVLGLGSASEAIVELAHEKGADLIVVGTRALGPVGRLLLGSVSSHIVAHARCPVLVLRKGDRLVLRLQAPPTTEELARLSAEFADILVEGAIEPARPFPPEVAGDDHLDKPRIVLRFDRHAYGRLRSLIDELNCLDSAPQPGGKPPTTGHQARVDERIAARDGD